MQCTRFEELLFERLEGLLDTVQCDELSAHAATCPRCRALETSLATAAAEIQVPEHLTADVLALTSERAPLERALRQLDLDLPTLATMTPDDDFVADVMAATIEADRKRLHRRIGAFWNSLVQRPRFALEGAYLGALLVFFLVGMPWSPFAGVPEQVLGELRNQDGVVRTALTASSSRINEISYATWTRAGDVVTGRLDVGATLRPAVAGRLGSWGDQIAGWFASAWARIVAPMAGWIADLWASTPTPLDPVSPAEPMEEDHDNDPDDRSA